MMSVVYMTETHYLIFIISAGFYTADNTAAIRDSQYTCYHVVCVQWPHTLMRHFYIQRTVSFSLQT